MNKTEDWQESICLLCGEFMGSYGKSSKDLTNFTKTSIEEFLDTFIPLTLHHHQGSICQNCFIKLNEIDEHQMIAERIKSDLLTLYNQVHNENLFPEIKVKVEEVDFPIEEEDFDLTYKPHKSHKKLEKPQKVKPIDESVDIRTTNGITIYECKVCNKIMKHRGHMQQHVLIHKDVRNFCCQECGMTFKLRSHLNSHYRTHSGKKEKMICDICGKLFDQKFYLREHMNAIHLDIRKFTCSVCNMTFARKRCLMGHARVHQDESLKKVICEVCGFRTHTKQAMVRHSRTHTGERNFACNICGKMFACDYNVTAHINSVHKGIRPKVDESKLRCMLCGKKFSRQKQLRKHLEEHNVMEHTEEFAMKN